MKFVIVSPHQGWGGAIVLHTLCKELGELGFDAKIFLMENTAIHSSEYSQNRLPVILDWLKILRCNLGVYFRIIVCRFFKNYKPSKPEKYKGIIDMPIKGCQYKISPFVDDDTIVIYPEKVYGNPLRAKKVVRFLLYKTDIYQDSNSYGSQDLFFCYREIFNDYVRNPECNILHVCFFDLELYKRVNYGKREGNCFIIRKGVNRKDLPKQFDGIIIDGLAEREIVDVFNKCEYCISYDTQTAYSSIAAICGCISIVVPEEGKTRSDYVCGEEMAFGRAYGFDKEEIDFATRTVGELQQQLQQFNYEGKKNVRAFAKKCEEYFT